MFKKLLKYKKTIISIGFISACSIAVYASTGELNNTNNNPNISSIISSENEIPKVLSLETPNSCVYKSQIDKCISENKTGNPLGIDAETDFVCIQSQSAQQIAYNVVLDKEFKIVDKEVITYLTNLEFHKNTYFGDKAPLTIFDAVKDLDDLFADETKGFYKEYIDLCSGKILEKTMDCLGGKTANINASEFINANFGSNICLDLAKTKLDVYHQVALNILKLNKEQVIKDGRTKYMQEQRTKYDKLIDNMSNNGNYVERINSKWNVVTKNPMGQ